MSPRLDSLEESGLAALPGFVAGDTGPAPASGAVGA